MIHYANSKGLLVLVAGLDHPVFKFPSVTDARTFARNLGARLAGFHVAISPGLDTTVDGDSELRIDGIGLDLRSQNKYMLLVNHYGTPVASAAGADLVAQMSRLHTKTWLDGHLFQSGFNAGNAELIAGRAREMPQILRGFTGLSPFSTLKKPAINAESIYSFGYGYDDGSAMLGKGAFNSYRVRQAGWLSWLDGATGYTIGSVGVYDWGMCSMSSIPNPLACDTLQPQGYNPAAEDPAPQNSTAFGDHRNYQTAMAIPGDKNMSVTASSTLLSLAMKRMEWSILITNEQNHILLNGSEGRYKRALARDRDMLVAYMPHNERVKINLTNKNVDASTASLYNPRKSSAAVPLASANITNHGNGVYSFYLPHGLPGPSHGADDWLLVVEPTQARSMTWIGSRSAALAKTFTATADINPVDTRTYDPKDGGMIRVRVLDATGALISEGILPIQPAAPSFPRRIRGARDGQGRFFIAWEKPDSDGLTTEIGWAIFGEKIQEVFAQGVLHATQADALEIVYPTIAADDQGAFLIVWEERLPDDSPSRIFAQRFLSDGEVDGPPFELLTAEPGGQRAPRVACGPTGECWVAWEQFDPETGATTAVRAQRLEGSKSLEGLDFQLTSLASANLWLTNLSFSDAGIVTGEWERFDSESLSMGLYSATWAVQGNSLSGEALFSGPPPPEE